MSVTVLGSNIFMGGSFTIPEAGANGLAYWNGISWNSPGGPLTNVSVYQLLTVGNYVYADGFFNDASSNQFGSLIAWDGTQWANLRNGDGFDSDDRLATDGTNLYSAHTTFLSTALDYAMQFEEWHGTNLTLMGDNIPSFRASALAVCGTNFYLAGSVTTNNYNPTIYSWDGVSWQPIAAIFPTNSFISSLAVSRGNLYVAGSFSTINGIAANSVAEWTGSNWLTLSNGLSNGPAGANTGFAEGMVAIGRKIFVGGQFSSAGGLDSGNFAVWNETPQIGLQNARLIAGSDFAFDLLGLPGDQLEIQSSDSLSGWTPIGNLALTNSIQPFTVTPPTNSNSGFYRVRFVK
jgi:trimeric autotransporter adhesin